MSYRQFAAADQRMVVLQALEEDPGYSHNEGVLRSVLGTFGHQVSRDSLRTELAWLAEQGLITLSDAGGVQVARLTARGQDVAQGHARVPGVARPRLEG
ncbi:ArsR family transcriptional regulator [Halomonas sp.]|uniref:VpaChn25_0724 family phage protein n=1 Tax=Halomonas sp. TaxID=1486246 RepID=UPI00257BF987|nr:ArsR family transcriptional regulator [Halomonas sp.]MCJ8285117.1 ArsR family transcriptional regulator [Halomonas sp.]NQY70167.1 ArsR family transcriptional regulator [Halomonas sp.]